MNELKFVQVGSGVLLTLSGIVFMVGGMMFTARVIWKLSSAQTHIFLIVERSIVMTSFLISLLGLVLFERQLDARGDHLFALTGMTIYLAAVVMNLVFEAYDLAHQEYPFSPIFFVALAFLGQATYGASILAARFLPVWIGWFTILWNLAWLVILPIARPRDLYYPWLHFTAPLVIGIALLLM